MTKNDNGNWVTEPLSPYRLAGIMSVVVETNIRPQAIYGATRPNKETGESRLAFTLGETGHQVVAPEDANQFIQDYLDRQAAKEVKAKAEMVEVESDEPELVETS